jgi:sigma-B regulation protein RsbU (phosphoserine phosphatase)
MATPRILIVDDEPFNVDYLEQELEEFDCKTIAAINGRDALDKVHSEPPDLVLLDIMMPIMDGFEVLSKLKADPDTRDIPVIVISANTDLKSVARGIQLGAEDYLPKPFEPTLLHARILSSLEKKRLRDIEHLYLKSLERELEIAHEIQMSFLPASLPEVDGWEIATYFKSAREVAGDFYDAFLMPDGNLACVVGDVCDKGLSAALFMTLFRSLIRATSTSDYFYSKEVTESLSHGEQLQHILSFTNHYITKKHNDANMFATVFIGIFNLQNNILSYANCGNEPPLLLRSGEVVMELQPTGPVLGLIEEAQFYVEEISFIKNDLLLAFTDGLPDSKNAENEFFRNVHLIETLGDCDRSPSTLLEYIETQIRQFSGKTEQYDDITLMAVKRVL